MGTLSGNQVREGKRGRQARGGHSGVAHRGGLGGLFGPACGKERPWQTSAASGCPRSVAPNSDDAPSAVHRLDRSIGRLKTRPTHSSAAQNAPGIRSSKPTAPLKKSHARPRREGRACPPNSARFRDGMSLGLPVAQDAALGPLNSRLEGEHPPCTEGATLFRRLKGLVGVNSRQAGSEDGRLRCGRGRALRASRIRRRTPVLEIPEGAGGISDRPGPAKAEGKPALPWEC